MTDQQRNFADYHHMTGYKNATAAAIKAGYSPNTAKEQASRLLTIVNPYLKSLQRATAEKRDGQRQRNIDLLIAIRDFDITDAVDIIEIEGIQTVKVKDFSTLPPEVRIGIASVKATSHGIEVKFHDKLKAIEMLNRTCGYNEAEEIKVSRKYDHLTESELLERIAHCKRVIASA